MLAVTGAGLVVIAVALALFLLRVNRPVAVASPEAFAEQILAASESGSVEHSVYGGAIRVARQGNQVVVAAENVPPNVCVSVGWKLVRKGLLSINGTVPLRVSAAKLSELCNQEEGNPTLTWSPRAVE